MDDGGVSTVFITVRINSRVVAFTNYGAFVRFDHGVVTGWRLRW